MVPPSSVEKKNRCTLPVVSVGVVPSDQISPAGHVIAPDVWVSFSRHVTAREAGMFSAVDVETAA